MPYGRIQQKWTITIKHPHDFFLDVREGFFNDTLELYVDDWLVAEGRAGAVSLKDRVTFEVDGRILELRWVWGWFTGHPRSIVILYRGRILAQVGDDYAAQDSVLG